ncbi:IS630 family transposase (plasmid) [Cupriavidus sp. P-10]|nr:IS630 family transposase [Cupriavidus sp. P-10]
MMHDKIDSRTLSVDALNERRRRAVRMRLQGVSVNEAAAQCELTRATVSAAFKAYEAGGWKAVDTTRPGRPRGIGRTLTAEQEREVLRLIRDRTPDQMKLGYPLWQRQAVAKLIRDRYGIELAARTLGLYHERWGFTPQRPIQKAYEPPAAVKQWLDEEYPVIVASAKAEAAEIHWGDDTGLRSNDVRGPGHAPHGQTPVVRVNNERHGLSVISSVTNQGTMRWLVFDGALNSDILINFVKRLVKGAKRKVYLILDNLRVHHSKRVKAWLAEHKREIEVFYRPSYRPELNPGREGLRRPQAGRHNADAGAHQAATGQGDVHVPVKVSTTARADQKRVSSPNRFVMPHEIVDTMPDQ